MKTIFAETLEINHNKIFCKVIRYTPEPSYLLCIPGGPGFDHRDLEMFIKKLQLQAVQNHLQMPI